MAERLQKILAARGIASRRGSEELIAQGLVTVNGRKAVLGELADPRSDTILVRGQPLPGVGNERYFKLHKPVGFVTSMASTHGERTVAEFFPPGGRLIPVGRLDKDTSGLLLLTSDGEWANIVTHPRYGVPKEYRVVVRGLPSRAAIEQLEGGVRLPDGVVTGQASVRMLEQRESSTVLMVTVVEGKKRQIRHMFAVVAHPVLQLERVRIGAIALGDLPLGRARALTAAEVQSIHDYERPFTTSSS
jgi:23S rRNA pseudouridine2605 synthase